MTSSLSPRFQLHILETPAEMNEVEDLQRLVWPGDETDLVPGHLLVTSAHNGGLVIGAYDLESSHAGRPRGELVGFTFTFPGVIETPQGWRLKHCSHMLGVRPDYRNHGLGFALKRAQWQMVRRQGIDLITWTYDPLLSRNAHLNIQRLGAVCNTYLHEAYGEMRDHINTGLPSDRFQVDWWVNTRRVATRLSKRPRPRLDLAHFLAAETPILNPTWIDKNNLPHPTPAAQIQPRTLDPHNMPLVLVEIPSDIDALKAADHSLALEWRLHTRSLFQELFSAGYLATDFIYLPATHPRSFYALSHGDSELQAIAKDE